MNGLPYKPRVKNIYSLTIKDIEQLKVANFELVNSSLFNWNALTSSWFIKREASDNEFWITIHSPEPSHIPNTFSFAITRDSGLHYYCFDEFYNPKDIESKSDLAIQEKFLSTINYLISIGILARAC